MKLLFYAATMLCCFITLGCTDDAGWNFKDDREQTPAERKNSTWNLTAMGISNQVQ